MYRYKESGYYTFHLKKRKEKNTRKEMELPWNLFPYLFEANNE